MRQISLSALVLALWPACSFDATGLGGAPAAMTGESTTAVASTTEAHTTEADPTTTGAPITTTTTVSSTGSEVGTGGESEASGPQPGCGDGVVDGGEQCDDGADNGDTRPCTSACRVNVCGDGHPLAGTEACDDGNQVNNDDCRDDCTRTPTCGNSKLDAGEQCDDGNEDDRDACILCKKAVCGDGFVQRNVESCDDGEASETCNGDCSLAKCGDMKLNMAAGEVCDLGAKNGLYASGCGATCEDLGSSCGDGVISEPDEKCDSAKPLAHATCTGSCTVVSCAADHGNCDGVFANGCEKDLTNDKSNCGECGKECLFKCTDSKCG